MIKGLYIELAGKRQRLQAIRSEIAAGDLSAQGEHSRMGSLASLEREIAGMEIHIAFNEQIIGDLERMIATTPTPTRHRSAFITLVEQASDRLRRELGDKPGL